MSLFVADGTVRYKIAPIGIIADSPSVAAPSHANTSLFDQWIVLGMNSPTPALGLPQLVERIAARTGWSNRRLAQLVGTTHPTIRAIRLGREPERRPDIADALIRTAEVVDRLSRLVPDRDRLNTILVTSGPDGATPVALLADGQYGKAYIQALDLIGRRRTPGKMLNVKRPRRPSLDTAAIDVDENLGDDGE